MRAGPPGHRYPGRRDCCRQSPSPRPPPAADPAGHAHTCGVLTPAPERLKPRHEEDRVKSPIRGSEPAVRRADHFCASQRGPSPRFLSPFRAKASRRSTGGLFFARVRRRSAARADVGRGADVLDGLAALDAERAEQVDGRRADLADDDADAGCGAPASSASVASPAAASSRLDRLRCAAALVELVLEPPAAAARPRTACREPGGTVAPVSTRESAARREHAHVADGEVDVRRGLGVALDVAAGAPVGRREPRRLRACASSWRRRPASRSSRAPARAGARRPRDRRRRAPRRCPRARPQLGERADRVDAPAPRSAGCAEPPRARRDRRAADERVDEARRDRGLARRQRRDEHARRRRLRDDERPAAEQDRRGHREQRRRARSAPRPEPIAAISRSPTAIPSATPITISSARRLRRPGARPSTIVRRDRREERARVVEQAVRDRPRDPRRRGRLEDRDAGRAQLVHP